jgi:hypothetical protein
MILQAGASRRLLALLRGQHRVAQRIVVLRVVGPHLR